VKSQTSDYVIYDLNVDVFHFTFGTEESPAREDPSNRKSVNWYASFSFLLDGKELYRDQIEVLKNQLSSLQIKLEEKRRITHEIHCKIDAGIKNFLMEQPSLDGRYVEDLQKEVIELKELLEFHRVMEMGIEEMCLAFSFYQEEIVKRVSQIPENISETLMCCKKSELAKFLKSHRLKLGKSIQSTWSNRVIQLKKLLAMLGNTDDIITIHFVFVSPFEPSSFQPLELSPVQLTMEPSFLPLEPSSFQSSFQPLEPSPVPVPFPKPSSFQPSEPFPVQHDPLPSQDKGKEILKQQVHFNFGLNESLGYHFGIQKEYVLGLSHSGKKSKSEHLFVFSNLILND